MATAALLSQLLALNNQITQYTQQQMYWSNKLDANSAKLAKQVKAEENYNKEYDKAKDGSRSTALKMNGKEFIAKETEATDAQAKQWAKYKVGEYDEELSLELADLDLEYDSMKTMCDTLLEQLRAQKESLTNAVSTEASDTHELGN